MTIRVAQWAFGNVGKITIEEMVKDPEIELVACYTRPGDKTGKDVGELIGLGPIGLATVSSLAEVVAAKPDLVLYMPLIWDVDAMVGLLEAGVNVISTANFLTGWSYGREAQDRLKAAALKGGASLFGTGINPGFAQMLAVLGTHVSRRVDFIKVQESVEASYYNSPETWRALGFGGPRDAPGALDRVRDRAGVFADCVEMIALSLGVVLDDILFEGELGVATEDLDFGYMTIAKGMACGMNIRFVGIKDGKRLVQVGTMTRLGNAMEPDWQPHQGYRIDITGMPNTQITFHSSGDTTGALQTAMPAIHAIRPVLAAKPGLVLASDLPLMGAPHRLG
ncbi:hypothetical protein ACFOD9_07185 [Novosphingobium bradum]|uniref:2,4-diaminopentanoate dehydrogenase C-terminal domain-containing protein n=1 Tax=Novosphingobium bradum TaxID=1737444 RepID=A0ABV7IV00_9SPHN